jgi:hypothetical protein
MIETRPITDRAEWPVCSVPDCNRLVRRRRCPYCALHYNRLCRNGDPLTLKRPANGEPLRYLHEVAFNYDGDACLIWPYARTGGGRGWIHWPDHQGSSVHVLVCEHEHGARPLGHEAAHSCGNGHLGCIARRHIRWATISENHADKVAHGRSGRGQSNPNAKLSVSEVLAIRADARAASLVAADYSVSRQQVWTIRTGRGWSHAD